MLVARSQWLRLGWRRPLVALREQSEAVASAFDYDICVIGAGPSGYAAAVRGTDFGKRVCLVERSLVGGTGVYNGAMSSKMMWKMARDHQFALQLSTSQNDSIHQRHYRDVVERVIEGTGRKNQQFKSQLDELRRLGASPNEKGGSVQLVAGAAKFVSPHEIEVNGPGEKSMRISASHFVIATGSSPREPTTPPLDGFRVMTSEHLLNLKHFPKSILIIGAG